jgi:hypothetical protein
MGLNIGNKSAQGINIDLSRGWGGYIYNTYIFFFGGGGVDYDIWADM